MNDEDKQEIAALLDQIESLKCENASLQKELESGVEASQTYMWPPPESHADEVLCVAGISLPCRVVAWIAKEFNLPVDICGIGKCIRCFICCPFYLISKQTSQKT